MSNLALDESGDLATPIRFVRGPAAAAQRVRSRFELLLGEYFLDTRAGVPWFETITVKGTSLDVITSIFRGIVLDDFEVVDLRDFTARADRQTRQLFVSFVAVLADGSTIERTENDPLIITVPGG